jgi:imidazolonepropionase-like amidohydrolase
VAHWDNKNRGGIVVRIAIVGLASLGILASACDSARKDEGPEPFASRYQPLESETTLLRGATVLTGTGERLDGADVLMKDGRIVAVGSGVSDDDATVVDAAGRWITPGIIDTHSHLGVYASPGVQSHSDGNEITGAVTAEVWAEHGVWPHDPGFITALAGGVTSMQILPGSANLIGGRSVTVKNIPGRNVQEMKFPGAPYGLKMACGENPKRIYGSRFQSPFTRMGNVAGYRSAWIKAADYRDKMAAAAEGEGEAPMRDLQLETLVGVLDGEILVHNHCYRGDEMSVMIDIAEEFGYEISSFHHAVEAYKVADLLAEHDICASVWADWWGFKMEAYDGIRENAALVDRAGACAIIHSDSDLGRQSAGSRRTRPSPWASSIRPARSSPARWPTWSSGAVIRSAYTRRLTWCTSMAHSPGTAAVPIPTRSPISVSARLYRREVRSEATHPVSSRACAHVRRSCTGGYGGNRRRQGSHGGTAGHAGACDDPDRGRPRACRGQRRRGT